MKLFTTCSFHWEVK